MSPRSRKRADWILAAGAVALLGAGSCEKEKCGDPFVIGNTYQATVLEPLSLQGVYPGEPYFNRFGLSSCAQRDGFGANGSTVKLRAADWIEGDHCFYPHGRLEGYPGETGPLDPRELSRFFDVNGPRVPFFVAGTRIGVDGCRMNVIVGLERTINVRLQMVSHPLSEAKAGQPPPAALHRYLSPADANSGCTPCGDVFAATVKEEK